MAVATFDCPIDLPRSNPSWSTLRECCMSLLGLGLGLAVGRLMDFRELGANRDVDGRSLSSSSSGSNWEGGCLLVGAWAPFINVSDLWSIGRPDPGSGASVAIGVVGVEQVLWGWAGAWSTRDPIRLIDWFEGLSTAVIRGRGIFDFDNLSSDDGTGILDMVSSIYAGVNGRSNTGSTHEVKNKSVNYCNVHSWNRKKNFLVTLTICSSQDRPLLLTVMPMFLPTISR